jgi:hypothetical protein
MGLGKAERIRGVLFQHSAGGFPRRGASHIASTRSGQEGFVAAPFAFVELFVASSASG